MAAAKRFLWTVMGKDNNYSPEYTKHIVARTPEEAVERFRKTATRWNRRSVHCTKVERGMEVML